MTMEIEKDVLRKNRGNNFGAPHLVLDMIWNSPGANFVRDDMNHPKNTFSAALLRAVRENSSSPVRITASRTEAIDFIKNHVREILKDSVEIDKETLDEKTEDIYGRYFQGKKKEEKNNKKSDNKKSDNKKDQQFLGFKEELQHIGNHIASLYVGKDEKLTQFIPIDIWRGNPALVKTENVDGTNQLHCDGCLRMNGYKLGLPTAKSEFIVAKDDLCLTQSKGSFMGIRYAHSDSLYYVSACIELVRPFELSGLHKRDFEDDFKELITNIIYSRPNGMTEIYNNDQITTEFITARIRHGGQRTYGCGGVYGKTTPQGAESTGEVVDHLISYLDYQLANHGDYENNNVECFYVPLWNWKTQYPDRWESCKNHPSFVEKLAKTSIEAIDKHLG
jgi:hypothetical protein